MDLPKWCSVHTESIEITKFGDTTPQYHRIEYYKDDIINGLQYCVTKSGWYWQVMHAASLSYTNGLNPASTISAARREALDFLSKNHHARYPEAIMIKTAMEIIDE